ncbi:MAG: gliding motility-associated C-terminal domain-containing protein [Bacteroidetes bacterium]|nr:gliding motility-associated C-terminal domain-containing protein [Bacteroidota bacterium]
MKSGFHIVESGWQKKIAGFFATVILIIISAGGFAQQDTVFWFAAPDISSAEGQSPIYLKFQSYSSPSTITVTQPANGAFTPIVVNLAANDNDSINLTPFLAQVESPAANVIATTGLKIASTSNITAYYEVAAASNREMFSLKGTKSLGTNFYTPFQKFWNNASVVPSTTNSIEIVATQANTTVLITPRAAITGHVANVTYSVNLDEGETYSARETDLVATTSLAGSIISADKPIAITVFSGALSNGGCTSSVGDQITPTDYLGTEYIIQRGTASGERVFILATENATSLTISNSGTTSTLINWGETYSYALTDPINFIESSKPVYVFHVSGSGCSLGGAQVPSLFCAGKYEQTFARTQSDSLGLILYTRSGFEDAFELNGNPLLITPADFSVVPGTAGEFVVALKYFNTTDVPVNTYNLVTNSEDIFGMGMIHGQSGTDVSYAYLSEFQSYPFVDAGLEEDTVCANVPYPLTGIVGGGSVTGSWGGSGYGTFSNGLTALTNTYIPSGLDTIISPVTIILSSTGPCPVMKDTLILHVDPAPIVNASADQTVCANNADVSLDGAVFGGSTTGIWSTLGTGTFIPDAVTLDALYVPSAADTTAGIVTLVLTSTGAANCNVVTDTMVVTISDAPVVNAVDDTIYVCSNNPGFSLSGTVYGATATGKWTTTGNGSFSPDNLTLNCTYAPTPTDVAGGSITIYLQSTNNGACTAVKDSVKVLFTPSPVVYAGGDILACTNEPAVDLAGVVSGATTTGQWSGGAGSYTPNSATLNASYTPTPGEVLAGTMTLTLTSTNNGTCISVSDVVQITFITPPFANFNFTDVCLEDTTLFTDFSLNGFGSIASWAWDFDDGTTSSSQNNNHLFPGSGNFDVELIVTSDAGCSDTTVKTVDVFELPVADFSYSTSCDNDLVIIDFTDNSTTTSDPINYWFYDFGGQGTQATQNPSQLFIGSGNFVITEIVKTINGCSDTLVQIINIPPRPTAGFYYNTSNGLNIGAEFSFYDTSSYAVSWIWDFGDGNTSSLQNPSNIYFENGTYTVAQYAYGPLGCVDSAMVEIEINTVTTEIQKLIPNAISPNGDGNNDVWKLNFIELLSTEAEVIVMNRWGQTLYNSIGYTQPFDGTYHGEALPEGTYFYIIKISEDEIYEGSLLILTAKNN